MPAELFNFPPRRDGDVPPDAVTLLRRVAKAAAESGADPSAVVAHDLELLLVCDGLLMLKRAADEAQAAWKSTPTPHSMSNQAYAEIKRTQRACVNAMRRAAKLRAVTPAGVFAKAAAVRRIGPSAAELAVSLAGDLLESPELRAAIWRAGDQK